MRLRDALAMSLNVPAVAVMNYIGIPTFLKVAQSMGVSLQGPNGDPVRAASRWYWAAPGPDLLDMTSAYDDFATGGVHMQPTAILEMAIQPDM